ncbi:MAG: hydrogenase expression/formation protein HypE [Thermoplasmatota archaeon]
MMDRSRITMGDGAGGELMQKLLREEILPAIRPMEDDLGEGDLPAGLLDDSASFGDTAFTIDGHTIWPLEFPGGDIGTLSIYGTVNDLVVVGAVPSALALSMVMEEGLDRELMGRIARSIGKASQESGVKVITGDTKIVEKGGVKGMITSTAGIGGRHPELPPCIEKAEEHSGIGRGTTWLRDDAVKEGDHIILSGSVGDHGISLLSFREGYGFETELKSDLAPMVDVMDRAIRTGGIVAAKDLTRGGLSNALNEWSSKSGLGIVVEEDRIPVKVAVSSACDMLGLDPYEIGNEGKVILGVADGMEEDVLKAIRSLPASSDASIIGRVSGGKERVVLETIVGGRRIMDPPYGDPVPRIC